MLRFDTAAILVVDGNAFVTVGDVRDYCIEQQSGVVRFEERRSLALDELIESPLIEDKIVRLRVLVKSRVLQKVSKAFTSFWHCAYVVDDGKFLRALFLPKSQS